ncbi:hypothetical protein TNCV_1228421 [Trichonephila clavipes]|nr:hypothetical protein TNCV_1228421 [Trichonephila clavipes]
MENRWQAKCWPDSRGGDQMVTKETERGVLAVESIPDKLYPPCGAVQRKVDQSHFRATASAHDYCCY